MRVGPATLAGGIFGVVGTLCFFIAFTTDYWLVSSDNCGPYTWPTQTRLTTDANGTEVGRKHVCTYWIFTNSIRYSWMETSLLAVRISQWAPTEQMHIIIVTTSHARTTKRPMWNLIRPWCARYITKGYLKRYQNNLEMPFCKVRGLKGTGNGFPYQKICRNS